MDAGSTPAASTIFKMYEYKVNDEIRKKNI